MKIRDSVVVNKQLLMEAIVELEKMGLITLSDNLLYSHKRLTPIIQDSWNYDNLDIYINEKEI